MAHLCLSRHGESAANLERRFTAHDDEHLTAIGISQARETGTRLGAVLARSGVRPAALYASPFLRAFDTARWVGSAFGLTPEIVPELREQSFGSLRGMPYQSYYDVHGPLPQGVERWSHRPPDGESLRDVAQRAGAALDTLARRHLGETIVVVSHGGVMAALRAHARGHFELAPESTANAGGYRLAAEIGSGRLRYQGPLLLFEESEG